MECVQFEAGTSVCWDHWISGWNVFGLRLVVPVCAETSSGSVGGVCSVSVVPVCDGTIGSSVGGMCSVSGWWYQCVLRRPVDQWVVCVQSVDQLVVCVQSQ